MQGVIRTGFPFIMGILRNTITQVVDIRAERERIIETLDIRSPLKKAFSVKLANYVYNFVHQLMAFLFLLFVSPILLVVAIAIKLDSRGPVFFRQERMGRGGHIFKIVKFRTMVSDAEKETGPVLASIDDDRVTRVGRILRHLRIDEIPQMWNVLTGEMALAGPRPERPEIYDGIIMDMPEFFKRLEVKPGITGLAQIRGGYHTEPKDKLRYDLLYIRRRSILLDLKIIAITAYICLFRKGAC